MFDTIAHIESSRNGMTEWGDIELQAAIYSLIIKTQRRFVTVKTLGDFGV